MAPIGNTGSRAATNDLWTVEERPEKGAWLSSAVFVTLLFAMTAIIGLRGVTLGVLPIAIILSAGMLALALRWLVRTTVVIDRRKGIIRIATVGALWCRREVRTLEEFDRVAVWERRTPIDAGYYASRYSIVLLGGKGPLPLLTTDDEKEASAVRDEVAAFLRFR